LQQLLVLSLNKGLRLDLGLQPRPLPRDQDEDRDQDLLTLDWSADDTWDLGVGITRPLYKLTTLHLLLDKATTVNTFSVLWVHAGRIWC